MSENDAAWIIGSAGDTLRTGQLGDINTTFRPHSDPTSAL